MTDHESHQHIQIRLQNFRAFRDSGWLDFAPLTCLVGRNSSGKSSIVSALLLLKQSVENEVFGSAITPLALSGQYCDLGQFKDVVHTHNESSEISFGFRVPVSMFSDPKPPSSTAALVAVATPRVRSPGFFLRRYDLRNVKPLESGYLEVHLSFSADEPFGPSLSRCEMLFSEIGKVTFTRTISGERRQHWRTYPSVPVLRPLVFRPTARSFFPVILYRDKSVDGLPTNQKHLSQQLYLAASNFFGFLENLLRRSQMIGPFRQPPERRYTFSGFGASRSGPSGEQSVDLLITEALLPNNTKPLITAVGYWLKALKLADSLKVKDIAKRLNLFEIEVKLGSHKSRTNLVDVGFGVSQVLPVLVQGLLMEPGGIYFVQEPEIHLHPDAQAGLADFFIYLAHQGVTSVIETHSEYLLIRLRRRLAEKAKPPVSVIPKLRGTRKALLPEMASVLLSQVKATQSEITKLEIGAGFQFENLPSGFMSQITEDRMLLLKAVSKRNA